MIYYFYGDFMKAKDIILLCIVLILVVLLFVFNQRKAITSEEFIKVTESYHLKTFYMTKQFDSIKPIQEAIFAESEDNWQIEYYVFDSTKSSIEWIHNKEKEQKLNYPRPKLFDENHTRNTNNYTIVTSQSYIYVSQIKNTLIFINVPIEYMNDANKIIHKMKY